MKFSELSKKESLKNGKKVIVIPYYDNLHE